MNNSQDKSLDISRYLFCEPPIKLSLTRTLFQIFAHGIAKYLENRQIF